MNTKSNANFLTGLITGVIAAVIFGIITQIVKPSPVNPEILVDMEGARLTRQEIKARFAGNFIPIENDEYALYSKGVSEWLEANLINKEARALNISVQDLYTREVWNQVTISPQAVVETFNKNAALYGSQPFESVAPVLTQKMREIEFEKMKQGYLGKLQSKYNVKIYLKKPSSYVNGLALPVGPAGNVPPPAQQAPAGQQQPPPPAAAGVLPPATANFTDLAGRPAVGPENAPITLVEFSDFHCPFCQRVEPTIDQLMKAYPGKIRKIWRHYPLPFHTGADHTHEASECAHEQGKFWEYHGKLFTDMNSRDDAALIRMAEQVGADKGKFEACLKSGKYKSVVQADMAKGSASGVNGTPAVFLNGRLISGAQPYPNFSNMVESLLDPSKAAQLLAPAQAAQQAPPPPPPAPTNVEFKDLDGRPSVGPNNAPITLVIFSDFFCPFCQRVEPTIGQLMKNYDGKIRKVWRHYPLPFHTGADRAHAASECAHEQGKFWDYHDKLFQNVGVAKDDATLIKFAEDVKLDKKKFEGCLTSNKYKAVVDKDMARGTEIGVRGTPAVFVNGQLVSGAQPYEAFDTVIKTKLQNK